MGAKGPQYLGLPWLWFGYLNFIGALDSVESKH